MTFAMDVEHKLGFYGHRDALADSRIHAENTEIRQSERRDRASIRQ